MHLNLYRSAFIVNISSYLILNYKTIYVNLYMYICSRFVHRLNLGYTTNYIIYNIFSYI